MEYTAIGSVSPLSITGYVDSIKGRPFSSGLVNHIYIPRDELNEIMGLRAAKLFGISLKKHS